MRAIRERAGALDDLPKLVRAGGDMRSAAIKVSEACLLARWDGTWLESPESNALQESQSIRLNEQV